jgi:hypothetical protein
MYGQNYIYEPIYYNTPLILFFWSYNYRPYVSNWYWDYYPSYYYAWNFSCVPIQKQYQVSLNINNYNYVNYRRSNQAVVLTTRDVQMGMKDNIQIIIFEKKYNVSNRYELEQRRSNRNEINYSQNRSQSSRGIHRNEERAKEIFLKIETNRHEKESKRRRSKRLLKKEVILQRKHFEAKGI